MAQDDLAAWLKVSAENKITAKNTWKSPLIEHFSDLSQFRGRSGINFQKAGCTLEGCVKVYSTRVDDVADSTNKLLGMFGKEEGEQKKRPARKEGDYVEKNTSNIDLKETPADAFYDPVFSAIMQHDDRRFLVELLERSADGMLLYSHPGSNGIVHEDEPFEMEFKMLPVSASLKGVDDIPTQTEQTAGQLPEEDAFEHGVDMDDFNIEEENTNTDVHQELPLNATAINNGEDQFIYNETPFGYFKGWAGPSHWKTTGTATTKAKNTKPKERFFLDFTAEIDYSELIEQADTTMSRETIVERRKNKNLMPTDFAYNIQDLYKFILRDDYIKGCSVHTGKHSAQSEEAPVATDIPEIEEMGGDHDMLDVRDDVPNIDDSILSSRFEQSMVLENTPSFTTPKVQKHVDMERLKKTMQSLLEKDTVRLSSICKETPALYEQKEREDISVHLCFISLLHLANENSYELSMQNGDVLIHK